jgi:hypothetical protein
LKIWRDHPGFCRRFTGRFSGDGNTFGGTLELNEDEAGWNDDLKITYRRAGGDRPKSSRAAGGRLGRSASWLI